MRHAYRVLRRVGLIIPINGKRPRELCVAEGTVVELMDQTVMFRDTESPVTRRPDEILVRWVKRDGEDAQLGFLARDAQLKEAKGPLTTIRGNKAKLSPWDRIRARVFRADRKEFRGRRWHLAPWLATFGEKHIDDVKLAIREFGGKPKEKDVDALVNHLTRIILKSEMDMKTMRKEHSKKSSTKSSKSSTKKSSKKRAGNFQGRTSEYAGHVIKKLQTENPRREGTLAGKSWDLIKKGMTYDEFMAKGGRYASLMTEIRLKRVKMIPPKR